MRKRRRAVEESLEIAWKIGGLPAKDTLETTHPKAGEEQPSGYLRRRNQWRGKWEEQPSGYIKRRNHWRGK